MDILKKYGSHPHQNKWQRNTHRTELSGNKSDKSEQRNYTVAFVNRFVCRVIVIILYFNRKKAHAKLCESQRHGRERQNGNEKNAHGDTNFVSSNHHQQHAK